MSLLGESVVYNDKKRTQTREGETYDLKREIIAKNMKVNKLFNFFTMCLIHGKSTVTDSQGAAMQLLRNSE